MATTKCPVIKGVITALGTTPQERGLETPDFKAKFDEEPNGIIDYINNTLTVEVDAHMAEDVTQGDNPHGIIYEEGTWTPGVSVAGTDIAGSYLEASGTYIRYGNLVTVGFVVNPQNINREFSGALYIDGLPYQAIKTYSNFGLVIIDDWALPADAKSLVLRTNGSNPWLGVTKQTETGSVAIQGTDMDGYSPLIRGSITYNIYGVQKWIDIH